MVGFVALVMLVAETPRSVAGDSCTDRERDERGQCPAKAAAPSRPPPRLPPPAVKKTELDIQGPDVGGARVVLDGQEAGYAPLILETAPGQHQLEVRKVGYVPYSESINAKQAQRVVVVVQLRAARAPAPVIEPKQGSCPDGMMHVPSATFQRGDLASGDERRVETVTIKGYCIDATEVTVKAYAACVEAQGCSAAPRVVTDASAEESKRQSWFCNQEDRPSHPVNCVKWEEAVAYCKWAGKRLPTKAEWRYAAQGQDGRTYPWGNDPPSVRRLNACGTECVAMRKRVLQESYSPLYKGSDGWETTAPVGSFPGDMSPFGVLDMAGNVREWTDTKWELNSIVCGGSWLDISDANARVESCDLNGASHRYNFRGFRCARDE